MDAQIWTGTLFVLSSKVDYLAVLLHTLGSLTAVVLLPIPPHLYLPPLNMHNFDETPHLSIRR